MAALRLWASLRNNSLEDLRELKTNHRGMMVCRSPFLISANSPLLREHSRVNVVKSSDPFRDSESADETPFERVEGIVRTTTAVRVLCVADRYRPPRVGGH